MPEQSNGQQSQNPICCEINSRVCDTCIRDDSSINARPFHTPILKPEVADWVALKYDEKEVDSRIEYDQCHGSIYDNPMNGLDAYPK